MYNRYIPQNDGSYRRNRLQDPCKVPPQPPACAPPPPEPCVPSEPCRSRTGECAGGFLKRLLPKGLDTGDLLIVLLLLLMAGDRPEDQNTALLTLAIYLFS